MVNRHFKPLKSRSFFLFGPRGAGKSTWLREQWSAENALTFNLLAPEIFDAFLLNPNKFREIITTKENLKKIVIVDEVQKVPALLDIAHDLISESKRIFVLTGSSARRLKQKEVNLLAGRASVYHMYPLSMAELGESFDLVKCLERGLLPEAYLADSDEEYKEYLKAYFYTYIQTEIQQEQWVRNLEPFRRFLEIAAQMNAKIINKSKMARQVGVESSTIESYFEILEDTLLGFRLPGFETSVRRQVRLADKFYFVDTGIARGIERTLTVPMVEHTSYYGSLFETFVIMELKKMMEYHRLEWSLSYLQTKDDVEIDVIITRPRQSPFLIEIKSTKSVGDEEIKSLVVLGRDIEASIGKANKIVISQDKMSREKSGVYCFYYREAFERILSMS